MTLKVFLGVFAAIGATLFLASAGMAIAWWAGDGSAGGTRFFSVAALVFAVVTVVVLVGGREAGKCLGSKP